MPPKVPSSSIPTTVIPPRDEATAHHGHVILFKTPHCGEDTSSDPYARLLGAHRFEASFIPVLEDTYDTTRLEEVIRAGSQTCDPTGEGVGMYDAVIITSKRGAEGWVRAARNVQASGCGAYH
jgi:uroporphyrinogen-III synthase